MFFEQAGKIVVVGKAHVRGDLGERPFCVADLALGKEQAPLVDVFTHGFSRLSFEDRCGIFRCEADESREGTECVCLARVFLYVTQYFDNVYVLATKCATVQQLK